MSNFFAFLVYVLSCILIQCVNEVWYKESATVLLQLLIFYSKIQSSRTYGPHYIYITLFIIVCFTDQIFTSR